MSQIKREGFETLESDKKKSADGASKEHNNSGSPKQGGREKEFVPLPEVTFATFILSINTSALVHLGELEEPGTGRKRKDLQLAQHAIDTLVMLQEKTTGNLTDEERALIEHVIYDLRLRYVKASS